MAELLEKVMGIIDDQKSPMTIRHLFYQLETHGVISKTELAYKSLCSHLSRWRKNGSVPWDAFADSTRSYITPPHFDGIADVLRRTRESYRRNLWATQPYYTEVWVEKDAICGVISDITWQWGVPLFVCRGFASLTSLYSAAQTFREVRAQEKAVIIYHLADYDPSGHAAADAIERTFEENFGVAVSFERIAILPEHIEEFDLPTRPTKQSDSRSRNWSGSECVELDALPPAELRRLVEEAITSRIDWGAWRQLKKIERKEQATLKRTLAKFAV
jgi:hypothetical protein